HLENEVALLLVERYPDQKDTLQVFVNRTNLKYASGSFETGEPSKSGWWIVAQTESGWQLVAEGNGNVTCQAIEGYDLPLEITPECYDLNTGGIVDRATEITVIAPPSPEPTPAT
ncbi:hypothetical protein MUP65_02655, partial [Patescibacteria group bacterium]|nr:hypothetical protein [Patescibacteria group bacterium]